MKTSKRKMCGWIWMIILSFIICHLSFGVSACSKEETESSEWDNWQERNVEYLNYIVNCYKTNTAPALVPQGKGWKRLKVFSKDEAVEGDITDYVYAYVIEEGTGTESPVYTDSVRVIYQGRLIPTSNYSEGYVFDGTVSGSFSIATSATSNQKVSRMVDGYCTALQHMHRGDWWRIYIPQELGYGEVDKTTSSGAVSIPAYSMLIFDLQLVDFSPAGENMPPYSARQK